MRFRGFEFSFLSLFVCWDFVVSGFLDRRDISFVWIWVWGVREGLVVVG